MEFPFRETEVPGQVMGRHKAKVIHNEEHLPANSAKMVEVSVDGGCMDVMVINDSEEETCLRKGDCVGVIGNSRRIIQPPARTVSSISMQMIQCGPSVTEHEKGELVELLNLYRMCFAFSLNELGCTNTIEMDIVDDGNPVVCKPYRTSLSERETISRIVQEWKDAGIVTETRSAYASPVLLVPKKDGEPRLVIDYRKLNSQTVRKVFPTPNLDEHLETLHGAKMFTTLDLASGYLQVPLTESAKEKTAFITPNESGQFNRMVFGLINAPYEFSRLMHRILHPLKNKVAMWYLDDILVPSTSFEDMIGRLRQVFEALKTAKLTLKLSKCYFGYTEVTYLGYKLSAEGVRPGDQKAMAIHQFPEPQNKHEVRRFLGLCGFFRRFIPHYAEIAQPISELLKEDVPFEWTVLQRKSFQVLKEKLVSKPVLQLFNPKAHTELHCDASSMGLSGMLLQRGEDNRLHLIHAVSKKTTAAEKHYHSSKQELMAMVWSMNRLRPYLIGIRFLVVTDCQAIVHLNTQKTTQPQVARWATLLSEFDFDIKHRPGVKMSHIDALSRAPTGCPGDTEVEVLDERLEVLVTMSEEDQVISMQRTDTKLNNIIDILSREESGRSKLEAEMVKDHSLVNGILYKEVMVDGVKNKLWVVPSAMRKSLVVRFHDLAGHFAVDRTVRKIMEQYYFPGMRRYVRVHIQCCPECVLTKIPRGRQPGALHPIEPGRRPFEVINMDHVGPFVKSTKGNRYVLVMIDNLTKYVKLYPVRSCCTEGVTHSLKQFIQMFGVPRRVISDRGTAFTSKSFEEFCLLHGVRHTLNSVRHPQSNGQVERVNSTLVPVMQANMKTDRTWDKHIIEVERQLNNAYNKTLGDTPFHTLYGYRPSFHDGALRAATTTETWNEVDKLQMQARESIMKEHLMWKSRYDSKHTKPVQYNIGDIVFIRRPPEATGDSTKLQGKYRGPLVVTCVLPNDVYKVSALRTEEGRRYATTVHTSHIKGYHLPQDEGDDQQSSVDEDREVESPDECEAKQAVHMDQGNEKKIRTNTKRTKRPPVWHDTYHM